MSSRSRSRVIIVTGASDGIGAALAWQPAGRGHRLILAARSESALRQVAAQCQRDSGRAFVMRTDVTAEDDCRRLVERTRGSSRAPSKGGSANW